MEIPEHSRTEGGYQVLTEKSEGKQRQRGWIKINTSSSGVSPEAHEHVVCML